MFANVFSLTNKDFRYKTKKTKTTKTVNNFRVKKFVFPFNNGVALVRDEKYSLAFIDSDGQKRVCSGKIKNSKGWGIIFWRGLLYFFVGIFLYIKMLLVEDKNNERPKEEQNKSYVKARNISYFSNYLLLFAFIFLAFLFGFVVLGFVPNFLSGKLVGEQNYYLHSFIVAIFRTAFIYLVLLVLRFCPFMQSFLRFNLAGQNTLDGQGSRKRPPLNFLNFLIIVCLFSTFVISLICINVSLVANFFINLALFLFLVGLSYEFLVLIALCKWRFIKDLCFITTFLAQLKPNTTQTEVSNMAKIELENGLQNSYSESEVPLSSVFAQIETKLKKAERYEKSDVEWIVANVLNIGRGQVRLVKSISKEQEKEILSIANRRAKGEPLSSIFGFVDFYGNKITVNKKVLSPRMETELLAEEVIKKIKKEKLGSVLDLCTGSGAIAIAIKKNCQVEVTASDVSKSALAVAMQNAEQNDAKINFVQSDLFKAFKKSKKFDLIVSNPPYIKSSDIEKLETEVKDFDPKLALDGGEDGYLFYRDIIKDAPNFLNKKGYLFFEVGLGQAKAVAKMMKEGKFVDIKVINDYNKIERIVYGRID